MGKKNQGKSHTNGHLEEKLYISEMSCINHMISNIYSTSPCQYLLSFVYVSLPTNRTAPCRYIISVSRFMYTRYTSFLEVGKQLPRLRQTFPSPGGNYHVVIWQFDLANKKLRPTQVKSLWTLTGLFLGGKWSNWSVDMSSLNLKLQAAAVFFLKFLFLNLWCTVDDVTCEVPIWNQWFSVHKVGSRCMMENGGRLGQVSCQALCHDLQ